MSSLPYVGIEGFDETQFRHSSRHITDYAHQTTLFDVTALPNELLFEETPVSSYSECKQVILKNTGIKNFKIDEIIITGDFEIEQIGNEDLLLKKGEYLVFSVKFIPKTVGETIGGIYFQTKDTTGTDFIKLKGTGINDSLELTFNYGEVITLDNLEIFDDGIIVLDGGV